MFWIESFQFSLFFAVLFAVIFLDFSEAITSSSDAIVSVEREVFFQAVPFPASELNALYSLYNATQGKNWDWKNPLSYGAIWNFQQANPNPCTENWQGISCTSDCGGGPCYVLSLSLVAYGLDGTLPNSISDLDHMQTLDLSENPHLTGVIPDTITVMTTLESLQLSSNNFTGPIPESMDNLANLVTLDLSGNLLSSTIPSAISSLTKLTSLLLQRNNFIGSVPSNIGNLGQLTIFDVEVNHLDGSLTSSICSMQSLEQFLIGHNRFTGAFPECIGQWKHLTYFSACANKFHSKIPENITEWKKLTTFEIYGNDFYGSLVESIGNAFTEVTIFDASFNRLGGSIPSSMKSMKKLTDLNLAANLFGGDLSILTSLTQLEYLTLAFNAFVGTIPDSISNLQSLEFLELTQNFFNGTVPSTMTSMTRLKTLFFSSNKLKGQLPSMIGNMTSLQRVDLSANRFEGTIPTSLLTISNLQLLILDDNLFEGSLPNVNNTAFGNGTLLTDLKQFSVEKNILIGTLPESYRLLTNLSLFSVAANRLTGTLGNWLGDLRNLGVLHLSKNSFYGTIPLSIINIQGLHDLQLYGNRLSGSLPSFIGNLTDLRIINLQGNNFNGSIPVSWKYLEKLEYIYLSANQIDGTLSDDFFNLWTKILHIELTDNLIHGSIPSSLYKLKTLNSFRADRNYLSGSLADKFQDMEMLGELTLSENLFYGSLPPSLSVTMIESLDLHNNGFDGMIPFSYFEGLSLLEKIDLSSNFIMGNFTGPRTPKWKSLQFFEIDSNFFSGLVPSTLFLTSKSIYLGNNLFDGPLIMNEPSTTPPPLTDFNAVNNMLSGSLPPNLNVFIRMTTFNISKNSFKGELLGSVMQPLDMLELVDISNNEFSGNIANVFTSPRLHLFFAENNRLSGKFQNIFDLTKQTRLVYVDLSDNKISGSLSAEFFISQNLSSLALVKNCMSGSIPPEICTNRFMESLALDGLHTADACQTKFFSWLPSYVLRDAISGTIPSCLFEMEKLNTLHLSGNNIQGKISDNSFFVSPSLVDLSLSHNLLSGSIPQVIQNHSWTNLDLSFNKLNGKLLPSMHSFDNSQQSIALDVNRLSGGIPASLIHAFDINILRGNLFGCSLGDRSKQLPKNDGNYESYNCGSNNINVPLFVWAFIVGVFGVVYLLRNKLTQTQMEETQRFWLKMQTWWSVFGEGDKKGSGGRALNTFGSDLALLRWLCTSWTVIVVVVLIPIYIYFTFYYSTHEYTYAWFISLAYISGRIPAGIAFGVLMTILLWVEYNIQYIYNLFLRGKQTGLSKEKKEHRASKRQSAAARLTAASDVRLTQQERPTQPERPTDEVRRSSRRSYFSQRNGYYSDNSAILSGDAMKSDDEPKWKDAFDDMDDHHDAPSITNHSFINKNSIFRDESTISEISDLTGGGGATITTGGTKASSEYMPKDSLFFNMRGTFAARPFSVFMANGKVSKPRSEVDKINDLARTKRNWVLFSVFLILVNTFIVLSINASYVYAITTSLNPVFTAIVTLGVTLFKITWSIVVVAGYYCNVFDITLDYVLKDLRNQVRFSLASRVNSMQPSARESVLNQQQRDRAKVFEQEREIYIRWQNRYDKIVSRVLISLSLFNTVIAPLLAVLLVSPECFYYVIERPASVSVSYRYVDCAFGFVETPDGFYSCVGKSLGTHTLSYVPAFNYSYQCTSSLLANFVDVYLYRYLISGILMPLIFTAVKRHQESLFQRLQSDKLDDRSRASIKWWLRHWCYLLPIVSRIIDRSGSTQPSVSNMEAQEDAQAKPSIGGSKSEIGEPSMDNSVENPLSVSAASSNQSHVTESTYGTGTTASGSVVVKDEKANQIEIDMLEVIVMPSHDINQTFVARRFSTLIVGDLAILLTFGTIFPPLAVVIFISIVLHTLLSQLVIGRFITLASVQAVFAPYVAVVKRETAAVGSLIALSIAPISVLATIFWSFFLFDILGDDAGTSRSYWILLVMPILLIVTRTGWYFYSSESFHEYVRSCFGYNDDKLLDDSDTSGEHNTMAIELRPSTRPTEPTLSFLDRGSELSPKRSSVRDSTMVGSPSITVRFQGELIEIKPVQGETRDSEHTDSGHVSI